VVADGESGFVVPDGDVARFANRLCQLIEDEELRHQFSKASVARARLFDVDVVMKQWKELLEEGGVGKAT
jgi:glycosyltransferase involved in cell wall biosynthesis